MANYATLTQQINAAIKTNGANQISGQTLQTILDSMVASLGAAYQFCGMAVLTPTATVPPSSPDYNIAYIAVEPGTYANFGGTVIAPGEVGVFAYNGSWSYTVKRAIELVNNVTTDDATKGLSAAQGVVLDGKITQLGQKVTIFGEPHNGFINAGKWANLSVSTRQYVVFELPGNFDKVPITIKAGASGSTICYLSAYNPVEGGDAGVLATTNLSANATANGAIPEGTKYIYCLYVSGTNRMPVQFSIAGVDIVKGTPHVALAGLMEKSLLHNATYKVFSLGKKPNVDTTNNTLTFLSETIISVDASRNYTIPSNTVVPLTADGTAYSVILYNIKTGVFRAVGRNTSYDISDEILIGFCVYPASNRDGMYYFPFDYSLNGESIESLSDDTQFLYQKYYGRGWINNGNWADIGEGIRYYYCIPIYAKEDSTYEIQYNATATSVLYFLSRNYPVSGQSADAVSTQMAGVGTTITGTVPAGARWLYMLAEAAGSRMPQKVVIDGVDYLKDIKPIIADLGYQLQHVQPGQGTGILELNPENEVIPRLLNLNRRYVQYSGSPTANPAVLSLIHFSDLHSDNANLLRIKTFADKYADKIDCVIQTGDLIGGTFSDGMPTAYAQTTGFLNVIGNHDSMNREGTPPDHTWVVVDQKSVYDLVIAPYVSGWGVVQPANAATNGYCYYYKEFAANKVRLIVLDCLHWDATQLSWLTSVLADAKANSLHVLIAVHYVPFVLTQVTTGNPFTSIDVGGNVGVTEPNLSQAADAVKDFIDGGGDFVCWICGHVHQDQWGVGRSDLGWSNQLVISIATASVAPANNYSEMARANGNKTQDCFNIMGIDVTSKTIKLMRIGADYDRYMRHKNTLSWNYGTGTLIYTD